MAEKPSNLIVVLTADRVTKGAVRFMQETDEYPINLYLRKEQVEALGLPIAEGSKIGVTIAGS